MARIYTSFHPPFIPILRALSQAGHELVTMQPQFTKMLTDLDIPANSLAEFSSPALQTYAINQAANLLVNVQPPVNGLGPAALDFMRHNIKGFLYSRLADLASYVLVLDQAKPDLILLHNDVEPLTRAAALWAQVHDVPALHIPHAVYLDIEKGEPGDDVHHLVTASHLAVAGWFQRQWYERLGAKNIVETGLPQFDKMATLNGNPQKARKLLGLNQQQPVITYASSWRQDTNLLGCHDGVQETYLAMLQVMKRLPDVQFIVKVHPRDANANWHVQAAQQAGVKCTVTAQHLETVLQASDAVLTYGGSNLLLEASFIPWLRMFATQGYEDDPEVIKIDCDPPDVDRIIETLASGLAVPPANTAAFQAKYLGRPDGRAWERITELCLKLVSR
jgi:UDP-N-acetylglucosamine 2-epimerase